MLFNSAAKYREKISQMVSWGHWFTLFNIIISLVISSRYLFIINWPASFLGRFYAIVSWLGHFGFLAFASYLLVFFPLTFVIRSAQWLRILAIIYATICQTLLLLDIEVFKQFHLHLNKLVWKFLLTPTQGELSRNWQSVFIFVPALFLLEMLFSTWSWQKLRSLQRYAFAKPIAIVLTCAFISSHLLYAWADANFYHPITMQKSNMPFAQPMTARRFLEKYGLLNKEEFQKRLEQEGDPSTAPIQYPLNQIHFLPQPHQQYNLLMIVIDAIPNTAFMQNMPSVYQFALQNNYFTNHFSTGFQPDSGLFGLFYGISPTYQHAIIINRIPSPLIKTLSQKGYQISIFSADGFKGNFYRQALFADLSLPPPSRQSNRTITNQWLQWFTRHNKQEQQSPWFSYISYQNQFYNNGTHNHSNREIRSIDQNIQKILSSLTHSGKLKNTIVVITAKNGISAISHITDFPIQMQQIHVPLVIYWPGTSAQTIHKMTNHADVMLTLMQRMLYVTNPSSDYSQGEDLFRVKRQREWMLIGDSKKVFIITPKRVLTLNSDGTYQTVQSNDPKKIDSSEDLSVLLQVLSSVKQFIAD